MDSDKIPT